MLFNHVTRVALLLALVGTTRRGLQRRCWTFYLYLLAVLSLGSLMAYWPGRFYTWGFYTVSRDLYASCKLLVAVELGLHVFRAFPRARRVEQLVTLLLLLAVLGFLLTASPLGAEPWLEWRRRLNVGTLWLFASWALLAAWYHLPLDRWHAALLGGFTAQLVVQTLLLARWQSYGLSAGIDPLVAYWWAFSAWRPESTVEHRYTSLYSGIDR